MFVGWSVFYNCSHQFWLWWFPSRAIACRKTGKMLFRTSSLWLQTMHSLSSSLQYWEANLFCSGCVRVTVLLIITVFMKDISLAHFSNKWNHFCDLSFWEIERAVTLAGTGISVLWDLIDFSFFCIDFAIHRRVFWLSQMPLAFTEGALHLCSGEHSMLKKAFFML